MAVDPDTIFWIPDTYFVNGINPSFQEVTKDIRRLMIYPNGNIYYSSRWLPFQSSDQPIRFLSSPAKPLSLNEKLKDWPKPRGYAPRSKI